MLKRRCGYGGAIVYAYYPPLIHASRILQYLYLSLFHKSQELPFLHGRLSVPLCSVPCGCWSLSSMPPPPTDAQSIHLSLSILAIIYHYHSRVAHPVVAEEVGHGVLEVSCREGSRHPPTTAPLITFLAMSFAYYNISDTTRINPRPDTWRHIVVVIHFFKLEITNTSSALLQIWRRI